MANDQDPFTGASSSSQKLPDDMYLVGFVTANILCLRRNAGGVISGEMVNLVRQPVNAIQVFNLLNEEVGHIESSAARVLCPLMDCGIIMIQGVIPKMYWEGYTYEEVPCQIHIFTTISASITVKSMIQTAGLHFISANDPSMALSELPIVKEHVDAAVRRSVDEIFKVLSEKKALGTLDPPNAIIKSELLPHQKEGLWWLVQQEKAKYLPPCWEEIDGHFVNALANYSTESCPDPIRGGIFADEMGLGKTLTILSLIALDKFEDLEQMEGIPIFSIGESSESGRASHETMQDMCFNMVCSSHTRTTLVVCPPVVLSVWMTQLEEHTTVGSLKVYMYYGSKRTKDANALQQYDLVLTTYNIVAKEYELLDSPMKMIEWWRVVLDEAHVIKNSDSKQSQAVNNLKAKRRWVVTGTPVQNSPLDLYAFMAFLKVEPFSIKNFWNTLIQRPLLRGDQMGFLRLQALMDTMSLRRTKDKTQVGLPTKIIWTYYVDLSDAEREIYDQMEFKAKQIIQNYIHEESSMKNYWNVLSALVRLRQICADVSLVPAELRDLLPSSQIGDVQNNPQLLPKVVMALQDDDDINCPICISHPKDTVITCCAHIFCKMCILTTLQENNRSCPICRHPLTESDLFFAPSQAAPASDREGNGPSTKATALLKLLLTERELDPTAKSIVFSQFSRMLHLLEEPLKAAGLKIQRLDGSMNANKRAQVIREFSIPAPEGATVLLASLKSSGVGVNLTMASSVYLFDPWWNPAVEEQAMDRVHRIGQRKEVRIVRMIALDTIEERILRLQEKKKSLTREVFMKKQSSRDQRDISTDDLISLMQL